MPAGYEIPQAREWFHIRRSKSWPEHISVSVYNTRSNTSRPTAQFQGFIREI
jgi:hypothetical protein